MCRLSIAGAAVLVVGLFNSGSFADDPTSSRSQKLRMKPSEGLTVHEWGTFSTFSGSNGKPLKFAPNDTDLPRFVYNLRSFIKGGVADSLVSLETPVLYFYTDRDRTVSIHVDFPKGTMTDWYPEASRPPSHQLRWDNIKLFAKDRPALKGERETGRYFAAREVDAASLQIATSDQRKESEKFIFYRGVGDFEMPLEVHALGQGRFTVLNTGSMAMPSHFLIHVANRQMKFRALGQLRPKTQQTIEMPQEASTESALIESVVDALKEQGLFEKEARAMVKTWKSDWFGEEGTRILYLVSDSVTNELLPMQIEPKPDRIVRTLVGRHDILTPERERELDIQVKRLNGASNDAAKEADRELKKLGRYRAAAVREAEKRMK